jgi:peptide/nickel transport system permease protein
MAMPSLTPLEYALRRLLLVVPTMLGVSVVVFLLMRLVPADVVDVMIGSDVVMSPAERATLRQMFGLDRSLPAQYLTWLGHVAQGELGTSLRTAQPVTAMIAQRVGLTVELAALAVLLSAAVAVPLGVLAAVRRHGAADLAAHGVTLVGLSLPYFWVASLLLLASSYFRWSPSLVWVSPFADPRQNLGQMALPVLSLSAGLMAIVMRMTRSAMLEVLDQDYIRTARAKGVRERSVMGRHALRNAAIPIVTVIGLQTGYLLGGAVVIEQIFGLPGIGLMILEGIYQRDYPVVQGGVLFVAGLFVLTNIAVDLGYAFVDPRIRYG